MDKAFSDTASNSKIVLTSDGSDTLYSEPFKEHYHSVNGAVAEALHVYIQHGFKQINKQEISVFEMGFGTGLNAFLSCLEAEKTNKTIRYFSIEKFPVSHQVLKQLNYCNDQYSLYKDIYLRIALSDFGREVRITENFILEKQIIDFEYFDTNRTFDLVYFDAFSPDTQSELWKPLLFQRLFASMNPGGILTTYSSKGTVKQALRNAGFVLQRLPGPAGKRHMLRAIIPFNE